MIVVNNFLFNTQKSNSIRMMNYVSIYTGTIFGSILLIGSIVLVIFVLKRKKAKHEKENKTTQNTQGLFFSF
jgi:nitrate reductase gamma subunit